MAQPLLVLSHGVPGCGKSSLAAALEDRWGSRVAVAERDRIRAELLPADYHAKGHRPEAELLVSAEQLALVEKGLRRGRMVVCTDTNLMESRLRPLVALARSYGAALLQAHFDVPFEVCLQRNRQRRDAGGRFVDELIMEEFHRDGYLASGHLKRLVVDSHGSMPEDFSIATEEPDYADASYHPVRSYAEQESFVELVGKLQKDGTLK